MASSVAAGAAALARGVREPVSSVAVRRRSERAGALAGPSPRRRLSTRSGVAVGDQRRPCRSSAGSRSLIAGPARPAGPPPRRRRRVTPSWRRGPARPPPPRVKHRDRRASGGKPRPYLAPRPARRSGRLEQRQQPGLVEHRDAQALGLLELRARRLAGHDVVVFFDTDEVTRPPAARMRSVACSRVRSGSVPVSTKVGRAAGPRPAAGPPARVRT